MSRPSFTLFVAATLLTLPPGCAQERRIQSTGLPIHGTDPLAHTAYLGSDQRHHHFVVQQGKSHQKLKVRRDAAAIEPAPFPLASGRSTFVQSAGPGTIRLLTPKPARPRLLDDYLLYPIGTIVEHNTYFLLGAIKPELDRAAVRADIVHYLAGGTGVWTHPQGDESIPFSFRSRDFWALMLAEITGTPLELSTRESHEQRDRKISQFLNSLPKT